MKVFLLVSSLLWGSNAFAPVPKVQLKPAGLHPTGSAFRKSFKSPSLKSFALCAASKENVALCLKGGGFLAFAVHSGLISGLLRSANAEGKSTSYHLADSKLLDRVETVVSNSGGTWYAAELMYSKEFLNVTEEMAKKDPLEAESIFKESWTQQWINKLKPYSHSDLPSWAQKLVHRIAKDHPGVAEDVRMLMYFWKTNEGLTWYNFVETLLQVTAGMKADLTFGSRVNTWCKGKSWILNTSTMSPSGNSIVHVWDGGTLDQKHLKYTTKSAGALCNDMSPTRFSVVLDDPTAKAPLPIAAADVLTSNVLSYEGASFFRTKYKADAETPGMLLQGPQADLNLTAAVASSSAFLAGLATKGSGSLAENILHMYVECSKSIHAVRLLCLIFLIFSLLAAQRLFLFPPSTKRVKRSRKV